MITATLRPRPAKDPTVFYDNLALTLTARRDALIGSSNTVNGRQPLAWEELVEWLRFQCWYRRQETDIIDSCSPCTQSQGLTGRLAGAHFRVPCFCC